MRGFRWGDVENAFSPGQGLNTQNIGCVLCASADSTRARAYFAPLAATRCRVITDATGRNSRWWWVALRWQSNGISTHTHTRTRHTDWAGTRTGCGSGAIFPAQILCNFGANSLGQTEAHLNVGAVHWRRGAGNRAKSFSGCMCYTQYYHAYVRPPTHIRTCGRSGARETSIIILICL